MALVVKDRVKETTATTGTGTLTLAGAVTGFQSFNSALSNADTTYYAIFESSTGAWEVGLGTFTSSGTTLSRDTILESSNAGSAINLTAGAAEVFITQPAEKAVYLDANGYIFASDGRNLTNLNASNLSTGTVNDARLPATISSDITGNAATATKWATGRTISLTGDVTGTSGSFDGSGNLSFATTIAANSVALGTDTTGNYVATIATSAGLDGSGSSEGAAVTLSLDLSELTTSTSDADGDFFVVVDSANAQKKLTKGNINISGFNNDAGYTTNVGDITGVTAGSYITGGGTSGTVTVNVDATSANTASKVVARDASGNFSAGTITAALSGNATTATNISGYSGTYWTSNNDGSGSGLDADTVDGIQGSSIVQTSDSRLTDSRTCNNSFDNSSTARTNLGLGTGNSPTFAGLNINGSLNAVDNVYLAGTLYHEGDTDTYLTFGTNTITLATGGSSEITVNTTGVRLGDTGNGYFQPVSGGYGSIQIDGGAHNGWEGYSIGGRAVFMHDNSSFMGLFDDVNDHWALRHTFNGTTELYYDGASKIQTTSTGLNVTGTAEVDTLLFSDGSSQTSAGASTGKAIAMAIVFG